jgi:enamine deaminase RidA (YjgF/YER057c/UK114 family)
VDTGGSKDRTPSACSGMFIKRLRGPAFPEPQAQFRPWRRGELRTTAIATLAISAPSSMMGSRRVPRQPTDQKARGMTMAHKRMRPFNTRDTYPEQRLDNDLSQAVVARGTTVFLRGQVGQDLDTGKSVGIGDPAAQADQAMCNIKTLLAEVGAAPEHICKIVIYITDPRYREGSTAQLACTTKAYSRSLRGLWSQPSPVPSGWSRWTSPQ